mgnify:CR=1 FL=1
MKYTILIALLFIVFFSNCKKADESLDSNVQAVKLPAKSESATNTFYDKEQNDETVPSIEQKIIKEGNLRFETTDLNVTYTQIQNAVKSNNASIQNDTEGKDYGTLFRKLIMRVPSKNFDPFLIQISKGVSYFDNKEITSQDVTTEFIDIEARLKAKKVLESRYIELLKKANKVSEMLEIEAQLSAIREEIEAKQGQLNYMQNQVSLSTITVEFYKNVATDGGITTSYGTKIWNAFKSGFNNLSSFFISILSIWPFLAILFAVVYFIKKRVTSKNK